MGTGDPSYGSCRRDRVAVNPWQIRTVQQMRETGWHRESLRSAVQSGELFRVRRGYYAFPDAPPELMRCVRVGGLATGPTALPYLGLWKPLDSKLHVVVPAHARLLRDPDHRMQRLAPESPVHVHWRSGPVQPTMLRFTPLADVTTALVHVVECCTDENAVAVLDSALHTRLLVRSDLERLRTELPGHRAGLIGDVNGRAEAGGESLVRYRLHLAGYHVEVQVRIDGVGRVDLLVEGRLVVEVDGRATHDTAEQFEADRRRDRELSIQHLAHLRFTYRQIMLEWPRCLAAIAAALA